MADSNQLKRIDPIDFGEDDPFAELTKIMGFDPRQPARQPETPKAQVARPAEPKAPPAPEQAARIVATPPVEPTPDPVEDFTIDLERELLGSFDPEPLPREAASRPLSPAREPYVQPVAPAAVQAVVSAEPEFDLDDDFADELESDLVAATPMDAWTVDVEEGLPAAEVPEKGDDLFAELDFDVAEDDQAAPSMAVAGPEASADDTQLQQEIDLDFDVAMAEVDMEFETELDDAIAATLDATVGDQDEPVEHWEPAENPAEELDRVIGELDAAAHTVPYIETAVFDAAPTFGDRDDRDDVVDVAEPEPEMSFEDELKALLGGPKVEAAVLPGSYDDPIVSDAGEGVWDHEAYPDEPELGAPSADGLDLAEAFDDHAFDTAFERELAAETVAPAAARYAPAPDVDTVEVPDSAVAYTDEIDIPELAREEPVRAASAYDDYEPDYSELFASPAEERSDTAVRGDVNRVQDPYETALATTAAATAAISAAAGNTARAAHPVDQGSAEPALARHYVDDSPRFAQDDDFEQPLDFSDVEAFEDEPQPRKRGLMVAAVVGGVALLGAVGAFALSFGGGDGAEVPALVRADSDPVKVRPEQPGGVDVPNQDNKVFETMAGKTAGETPSQERLIASSEEPVDIVARTVDPVGDQPAATGSAKNEDRVAADEAAGSDSMEVAAVAPRRVKTMVVRPDGTLVPREEEPDAAAAAPTPVDEAPVEAAPLPGTVPVAAVPVEPVTPVAPEAIAETPPVTTEATPPSAPVAEARPADQPIEVVGEVAPERVAMAAPAGGWAVQIASQPSEEAAKSTYADLSRRYGSIIGDKPASIVKAEIAGKGTFWRVRLAAETRNDAIGLCERYKAAGGNCFVSK